MADTLAFVIGAQAGPMLRRIAIECWVRVFKLVGEAYVHG
jgi:hypothetical protein